MIGPEEVLGFWLDEVGPDGWYKADPELDAQIRDRFEATWTSVINGTKSLWLTYPSGTLAYIIVTDQFPRNMFRDVGKAFSSDRIALAAAKSAVDKGWDRKIDEPARIFFYMPLMHSENLSNQDRCVRLVHERMPQTGRQYLPHARAHREVIRQFGRFPTRNAALSRSPTAAETAYLSGGGYGRTLRGFEMRAAG